MKTNQSTQMELRHLNCIVLCKELTIKNPHNKGEYTPKVGSNMYTHIKNLVQPYFSTLSVEEIWHSAEELLIKYMGY